MLPSLAEAATIKGKVLVEGNVPENPKISMEADPVCKSLHTGDVPAQKVVLNPDQTLRYVFVYVKEGLQNPQAEVSNLPSVTIDQRGCMYKPHVLGIQVVSSVANHLTIHATYIQDLCILLLIKKAVKIHRDAALLLLLLSVLLL